MARICSLVLLSSALSTCNAQCTEPEGWLPKPPEQFRGQINNWIMVAIYDTLLRRFPCTLLFVVLYRCGNAVQWMGVGLDTRRISFEIGSNKSGLLMDTRKDNPLRRISALLCHPIITRLLFRRMQCSFPSAVDVSEGEFVKQCVWHLGQTPNAKDRKCLSM